LLINGINSGLNAFDTDTSFKARPKGPDILPGATEASVIFSTDDRALRDATQRAVESKKKATQAVIAFLNECEAHNKKIIERERTGGTQ
jgi:hypothetical protein